MRKLVWVRKFVSAALSICVVLLHSNLTHAASTLPHVANWVRLEAAAKKAEPYLQRQANGTLTLNTQMVSRLVDAWELRQLTASMDWVNQGIRSGSLVAHADHTITFRETGTSVVYAQRPSAPVGTLGSGGVTRIELYWWGYKLYVSAADSAQVAAWLASGVGATLIAQGILGWFSFTLPGAIVDVLLPIAQGFMTIGAGLFGYYAQSNGILIRFLWPAIPTGWWSQ